MYVPCFKMSYHLIFGSGSCFVALVSMCLRPGKSIATLPKALDGTGLGVTWRSRSQCSNQKIVALGKCSSMK